MVERNCVGQEIGGCRNGGESIRFVVFQCEESKSFVGVLDGIYFCF